MTERQLNTDLLRPTEARIKHALENLIVHEEETNLDGLLRYAITLHGITPELAKLLTEDNIAPPIRVIEGIFAHSIYAYQYVDLEHQINAPAPAHAEVSELIPTFQGILQDQTLRQTFKESLYRFPSVSKPKRYDLIPYLPDLPANYSALDIGCGSHLGFAGLRTEAGRQDLERLAQKFHLTAEPRFPSFEMGIDIQVPDDNWVRACSGLKGRDKDLDRINQAITVRNETKNLKRVTGNIFELSPLQKAVLFRESHGKFDLITAFFVLHQMRDTYNENDWLNGPINSTLNEGGIWLRMDPGTWTPDRKFYELRMYQKLNGQMRYKGPIALCDDTQDEFIAVTDMHVR